MLLIYVLNIDQDKELSLKYNTMTSTDSGDRYNEIHSKNGDMIQ